MNNKEIMAANIKRYMEQKGVTNQQICDELNLKYTTFMDWIKGVTYPRIGKIEAMANYFGVLKSDLIEEKEDDLSTAKSSAVCVVLKRLRKQSGLTADQVGALVGKSGKTVNAWENNHGQPCIETLLQLQEIYNVPDILAEFREPSSAPFTLSDHEKNLILAYRARPEMQGAVNTLLGITNGPSIAEDISSVIEEAAAFKTEPIESR